MHINMIELFFNWGLNLFDFGMIYVVTSALLGFRSIEGLKCVSFKMMGFALLYAIVMGTVKYIWCGFRFQAIAIVAMISAIRFITRELNIKVELIDSILVYLLFYVCVHAIALPVFLLIPLFHFSVLITNYLIYLSTFMILCIIGQALDANWLFKQIANQFLVKVIIFVLFAMFVVSFIVLNFKTGKMGECIELFVVLVVIASNSLHYLFKFAHEYMNVMPNKYHDTKKILALLNAKMSDIYDLEELKQAHRKAMELMDIEAVPQEVISVKTKNNFEKLMLKTITFIQEENNSTTEIFHEFDYEAAHPAVDDMTIAYLLSILLENAIQTMTHKPIYVDIFSTSRFVAVRVSNEAKYLEKSRIEDMFKSRYSSKASIGRGFGLVKLKQTVKKYKGKVSVVQEYNMQENTNYLIITLRF